VTPSATECGYLGVDVGTGSARAGVFDGDGRMLAAADEPIQIWRETPDFVEQSSSDIWRACCSAARRAVRASDLPPERIRGIGFDATCSLAALDGNGEPVTVSPSGDDERNVIVWMDHRATEHAARIDATGHPVLRYVGGTISPEMEAPKLLWLRENLPESFRRAARFFDLPDLLVHLATGEDVRSLCTTVCKWTYLGHETLAAGTPARAAGVRDSARTGARAGESVGRWDDTFFRQIGLGELVEDGHRRIGSRVRPMGERVGAGLTSAAAAAMGLRAGTPVAVAIIDAHAGGLGVLGAGAPAGGLTPEVLESRLALIGGTSSCHMAVSREPRFIPGVWGPYFSAMVPGLWLTEGGQSATGALIDHVIFGHARAEELRREARRDGRTVYDLLNERLDRAAAQARDQGGADAAPASSAADRALPAADRAFPAAATRDLHVQPDFHGNRSPRADATLRGGISGLRLSDSIDDLALLYLATVQAVAYGTRHIVETLNAAGYRIDELYACGGGTKNPLFLREHADATGCSIVLPREPEAVLLGSAVLGAVAAGDHPSVLAAMTAMSHAGARVEAAGGDVARYHDAKYAVFHRMHDDFLAYRQLMR
jgi:FGGY-family pentulose kinase